MTLLPFEDLPEKQTDAPGALFPDFWHMYPRKVGKRKAAVAYKCALKRASHDEILAGLARYKRNKPDYCDWMHPTTFLNGDHWEDEYDDRGLNRHGPKSDLALQQIAEHVKKSWYQFGTYPRDVLQACVDAGLLTVDEMEDVL